MTFRQNVGGVDRVIRIALGVIIIAVSVSYANLWWVLGVVVLATGIFRFCPPYAVFGISTYKEKGGGKTE